MAMVPFADLFNHKAAVVQLAGGYFVEKVCLEGQPSSDSESEEAAESGSEDSQRTPQVCQLSNMNKKCNR